MGNALNIIDRSLRLLGVIATGESAGGQEAKDALYTLNQILDTWSNEKLMSYCTKTDVYDLTSGEGEYKIGNSDADSIRPVKIEGVFLREGSGINAVDTPLKCLSYLEYQDIAQKGAQGTPEYYCYQPSFERGSFFVYPVPSSSYKLGISSWQKIPKFDTTTTEVVLPSGYEMCLAYWLAYHIAPEYGKDGNAYLKQAQDLKASLYCVNRDETPMRADSFFLFSTNDIIGG